MIKKYGFLDRLTAYEYEKKRTRALEAFASHVQASVYELINGIDACYTPIENLRNITYQVPRIYLLLNVSVICLCATTVH